MKHVLMGIALLALLSLNVPASAWDGFDADTTELVEVIPDSVPETGDTISVKSYDTNNSVMGIVENVSRNKRTIEIVVRFPDGARHTLVMEGH